MAKFNIFASSAAGALAALIGGASLAIAAPQAATVQPAAVCEKTCAADLAPCDPVYFKLADRRCKPEIRNK